MLRGCLTTLVSERRKKDRKEGLTVSSARVQEREVQCGMDVAAAKGWNVFERGRVWEHYGC
jgi:hypothetical protein